MPTPWASTTAEQTDVRALRFELSSGLFGIEDVISERGHDDDDLATVNYRLLPQAFGCRNWLSARVSTVAELDQVLDQIDGHDGAAYIEVMIPNEESQPMAGATIDNAHTLRTPDAGRRLGQLGPRSRHQATRLAESLQHGCGPGVDDCDAEVGVEQNHGRNPSRCSCSGCWRSSPNPGSKAASLASRVCQGTSRGKTLASAHGTDQREAGLREEPLRNPKIPWVPLDEIGTVAE